MPSSTPKQAKLMRVRAHGWKPPAGSKAAKLPVSVAKDFVAADKKAGNSQGGFVGEHDGSSMAMAKGGSALSMASKVTRAAGEKC